jgi:hypothetical protein
LRGEPIENWQGESCGFAGSRLGDAQQVAPAKQHRYGLCLNGRWNAIILNGKGLEKRLGQTQIVKTCHG